MDIAHRFFLFPGKAKFSVAPPYFWPPTQSPLPYMAFHPIFLPDVRAVGRLFYLRMAFVMITFLMLGSFRKLRT